MIRHLLITHALDKYSVRQVVPPECPGRCWTAARTWRCLIIIIIGINIIIIIITIVVLLVIIMIIIVISTWRCRRSRGTRSGAQPRHDISLIL